LLIPFQCAIHLRQGNVDANEKRTLAFACEEQPHVGLDLLADTPTKPAKLHLEPPEECQTNSTYEGGLHEIVGVVRNIKSQENLNEPM